MRQFLKALTLASLLTTTANAQLTIQYQTPKVAIKHTQIKRIVEPQIRYYQTAKPTYRYDTPKRHNYRDGYNSNKPTRKYPNPNYQGERYGCEPYKKFCD